MTNHIELLTDDELRYICGRISGKTLRDLYQKNGNAFSKLKRGFRPSALTDEEAYNFACANRNVPFVADFLNFVVDTWLREISEAKENAVKEGMTENIAIIETLADSYFYDRPALYFKIMEIELPVDDKDILNHAVKVIFERNHLLSTADDTVDVDDQLEQLRRTFEREAQEKKEEYEKALEVARQEAERLQAALENYKIKLDGVEASKTSLEEELKTYRELVSHVGEDEEMKPTPGFHYASLCVAYTDDFGRNRLHRVADVSDGEFSDHLIESAPDYTRLYGRGGPTDDGAIGVWDWRVIPNRNDPSKDYIESSYNDKIKPVEVVTLAECNSIEAILDVLRKGLAVDLHTERVLFSIRDGGKYEGVYCEFKVFEYKAGIVTLREDVLKLPVYIFSKIDMLLLDSAAILIRTNLGLPDRLARVKDPMNIVQNCIISKATWPVSQQKGFVRNEYQQIRAFLTELQTTDLYEEISRKCDCTLDEAAEYVAVFMDRADKIVIGDTVENDVMVQIIKNDPDAYDSCMKELRKTWEQENASVISEAQIALEAVRTEEARYRKKVEKEEQELSEIQKQISEGRQELERQRDMAEEVERLVHQKIDQAKAHAAEFIADSVFAQATTYVPVIDNNGVSMETSEVTRTLLTAHAVINSDDLDENDTYRQLLQTVQFELHEAGVAEEYTVSLAALLYGAYARRIPVLLAGPNGREIADAFAAGMDAKTAAVFSCICNENAGLEECELSDEDIIVIENPLQACWENDVIRMISKRERFYVLTQPFADDLVVEPRGLFNYCLPVLTELVVSGSPTRNYAGGKMSAEFQHYVPVAISGKYGKILDELKIVSLARENVQALITDMDKLSERSGADDILQLLLYPLAYATGERHTLIEKIETMDSKPSARVITRLKCLAGEGE